MDKNVSKIKIPRTKSEERQLKYGLMEDDNEDISYLNFRIIWPLSVVSGLSVFFFFLGVAFMEYLDHITLYRFATNELWVQYGKQLITCTNYYPLEKDYYPSILRQIEIKVLANIFFRVAVCVPMAVRIFCAMIVRNYLREDDLDNPKRPAIFHLLNESSVIIATIEVLSQGMFSIVTIRLDFPELYRLSFCLFVGASSLYMFIRLVLLFSQYNDEFELWDTVSLLVKIISTLMYFWTISGFFWNHLAFINEPPCHGYVPKGDAIIEYIVIISYLMFHLTILIDIRDVRFMCYPRTASGECEPLQPENFKKDGKFEHCRSYELRQRQVIGLEKLKTDTVSNDYSIKCQKF